MVSFMSSPGVVKGHRKESGELYYSIEKEGQRKWYKRMAVILSLEQGNRLREQYGLGPYEAVTPLTKAADISLGKTFLNSCQRGHTWLREGRTVSRVVRNGCLAYPCGLLDDDGCRFLELLLHLFPSKCQMRSL